MQYVDKQVKVAKEFYEVFSAAGSVIEIYKQAIKDGWQPGVDIPSIVLGAMPALGVALQGLDQVPAEFKTDMSAALMAGAIGGSEIAGKIMK
jgi:hypothetical protein